MKNLLLLMLFCSMFSFTNISVFTLRKLLVMDTLVLAEVMKAVEPVVHVRAAVVVILVEVVVCTHLSHIIVVSLLKLKINFLK